MVTDVVGVSRLHYAGIDNLCAGRTAGYFVGRLTREPGRVLLLSSRMDYRAHIDRIGGCQAVLAESFPHLHYDAHSTEMYDDADRCYRAVMQALKAGDLVGVYNSGHGSAGVEAALRKAGAMGKVIWVGHEMLDDHRRYIEEGAMDVAIDQDPDGQVISALQHVLRACGVVEDAPPPGPVEFRIFCPANVRRDAYLPGEVPASWR
jgi:LacI family transcriptional regulator